MSALDPLADAELEVVRLCGIRVYESTTLAGQNARWCPELKAMAVPIDITPDEAERVACVVLGLVAFDLAQGRAA